MANANLKPRRACREKSESISLYWSSFQPGQPVLFRVDYRLGQIAIRTDSNYTIIGRQMAPKEIRQRRTPKSS
jgi:hypothetical protein